MTETVKCPSADLCGGCSYQGVPYELQLKNKEGEVRGYLKNSGFSPDILTGIKPCPVIAGYRNKMEYTFGNEQKGGELRLGMHRKKSFISVTDGSCCQIVPEDFNTLVRMTLDLCLERGYVQYSKKFHTGLLRNLILRRGMRTGELLVNIVTSSETAFDEEGFLSMVMGAPLSSIVCGVLHTVNDDPSDAVNVQDMRILWGRDWYMEEIMGLRFKVGAFSFFQTNVDAAERLYRDALDLIPGIEGKTVYDLYCGTGTISQAMALKAKMVYGVEIVEEAVIAARENAALNGLDNCRFVADDVQNALSGLPEPPDVIVVDPPRSGIMPKALSQILSYKVPQILYISCNPKTMAENLRAAVLSGYRPSGVTAYDNFPFTRHTECVCLLEYTSIGK
ncbi:MAG: 23S rRNA (uracil(1939)-C(5))-methyltransferase RlmD [Firmicutes bacterium]|nr:23S rRNA (uracil(1939)-C(5))-methyltransferase RlmD [Bacillota bacterium]